MWRNTGGGQLLQASVWAQRLIDYLAVGIACLSKLIQCGRPAVAMVRAPLKVKGKTDTEG